VQAGHSLAVVERGLGKPAEAREIEGKAIQVLDGLLMRHPDNIRWRQWRLRMQSTEATLLLKLAETNPALRPQVLPAMRLAYELAKEDVDRNPGDNKLVDLKTVMSERLARYLGGIGRPVEGLAIAEESRADADHLVRADPALRRNLVVQENVRQLQGWLLMQANRLGDAEQVLGEADRLASDAALRWPDDMELTDDRASTLSFRVAIAMKLGDLDAAKERCRLALSVVASVLRGQGETYPIEALADLRNQAKQLGLSEIAK
jgi:tetratricopeptide (TPR) repeat protein